DRLEIIVVVSGSEEGEDAIVREYQSRFTNIVGLRTLAREKLYTAWNRACRIAHGKYLTNANTDDRLHPRAYEKMASVLEAFPDVGLVYCDCLETEVENETFETTRSTRHYENIQDHSLYDLLRYCYVGPFPMWRRCLHDEIGYFDDEMTSSSDYEFWIRIASRHKMLHLRETLGLFLSHDCSLSHQNVGAIESEQVMRCARRTIELERVFPDPRIATDPPTRAIALTAMAELCLSGPWYKHPDLALEFLDRAAREGASNVILDNNRAVLLAAVRNRLVDAVHLFEKHLNEPAVRRNLQRLKEWNGLDADLPLEMMLVQHPMVEAARRKHGINPEDVPPLSDNPSRNKSEQSSALSPAEMEG
ncbi:glycosyltransferase, partial [bacterium]|nr:glycosyltransferase [bacterium]